MKIGFLWAFVVGINLLVSTSAQQPTSSPPPKPSPTPQASVSKEQSPPVSDEDVVRITTNLVQVDAIVTDKNGKPVADLKPDEIEIFEDGKRQKISHFSFISNAPAISQTVKRAGTSSERQRSEQQSAEWRRRSYQFRKQHRGPPVSRWTSSAICVRRLQCASGQGHWPTESTSPNAAISERSASVCGNCATS